MAIDLSLFLTNQMMCFIRQNTQQTEEELEIIHYGIEVFFINLFKSILLLIVALCLGIIKPVGILFISFGCIRVFAAGVHAPSTFICTLLNFVLFLGGTYLCLYIPIHPVIRVGLFFISILLLIRYAPADTEDRPLVSAVLRSRLKLQSFIAAVVLLLIMLYVNDTTIKNLITCGVLLEAFMTTPVIYYIFRKGYRNYEKFNEQF